MNSEDIEFQTEETAILIIYHEKLNKLLHPRHGCALNIFKLKDELDFFCEIVKKLFEKYEVSSKDYVIDLGVKKRFIKKAPGCE